MQIFRVLADAKPKSSVLADAQHKRKPVEYRLRWVPTQNSGVGHVHFMFFVLFSFALGSQRKPSFQWNMGFNFFSYFQKRFFFLLFLLYILVYRKMKLGKKKSRPPDWPFFLLTRLTGNDFLLKGGLNYKTVFESIYGQILWSARWMDNI